MPQSIDLIASGYEYECPSCHAHNKLDSSSYEEVECDSCHKMFLVRFINHAE